MPAAISLPTGQVTFLFTDIAGSTRLLEALGDGFTSVLERHHELMRAAVAGERGLVVGTEGDAFFAVFPAAAAAVRAAVDAQRALLDADWPPGQPVRVRMGLHTGDGRLGGDNYVGLDVHRAARIAAAAHGGQVLVSGVTVAAAGEAATSGIAFRPLGEHRLRDLSRAEHLYQLVAPGLPTTFPPPRTLNAVPNNLPARLTSFVGRTAEADALRALIRDGERLVTLTGPGGIGKTRLALQVAADLIDRFADGVMFVDLSQTTRSSLVEAAIAEPLGVLDAPDRPLLARLIDHLRERELLLVIDNFEQVVEAAPVVGRMVREAPRVALLVTSRSPLRISGEREFGVTPLPLPQAVAHAAPDRLLANDAVALFVERATAIQPGFRLDEDNATAVAAICRRLDGVPLAIELAAARIRLFPVSAILSRLDRSLELLSGGARDLPERQRTLRATIAWSYDLLDDPARRLFARFSVFAGGASLDAIERVCGPHDELGVPVLDALAGLVEQSLIRHVAEGEEPRFDMLATIRDYAAEQLTGDDATDAARRHALAFADLAEQAAPELLGTERRRWLDRLTLEHDNLRAALDRVLSASDVELTARLAFALWRFWQMRGHLVEGRERLAEALRLPRLGAYPDAHARLLTAAGGIAYWLGDVAGASRAYHEALDVAPDTSDARLLVELLTNAATSIDERTPRFGTPEFREMVRDRRSKLDRALAVARTAGDAYGEANVLWSIGTALEWTGEFDEARRHLEQSVEAARRAGDHFHASWAKSVLADVAFHEGDLVAAEALARDGLRDFALVGDLTGVMVSLAAIATIKDAAGDLAGAMRLHGAAATFARRNGSQYLDMERSARGRHDPAALADADPHAASAYAAGEGLSLDDAIAFALGEPPGSLEPRLPTPGRPGGG